MENKHLSNFIGGGFWMLNKQMVKAFGLQKSLWLTNLYDHRMMLVKSGAIQEDDFFYITYDSMYKELGIKNDTQVLYVKEFEELGILEKKRYGMPAKNFYRINAALMIEIIYKHNKVDTDTETTKQCYHEPTTRSQEIKNKEEINKKEVSKETSSPDGLQFCSSHQDNQKRKILSKQPADYLCDQDIRFVFNHWNNLSNPIKHHKLDYRNKTCQKSITSLKWLLHTHKIPVETIIKSMDNYCWLLNLPNSKLNVAFRFVNVPLHEFVKFSLELREHNKGNETIKKIESWFIECQQSREELELKWSKMVKDEFPKTTEKVRSLWLEHGCRGVLTTNDENAFRSIAKKWHEYFNNADGVNFVWIEDSPLASVHHLFKALEEDGVDFKLIQPSWLLSEKMFGERLPIHWEREGMSCATTTVRAKDAAERDLEAEYYASLYEY